MEDEVNRTREALLRHSLQDIQEAPGGGTAADYHSRQESADSGVGLNSNYSLPHTPEDLLSPMDDQMDAAEGRWRRQVGRGGTRGGRRRGRGVKSGDFCGVCKLSGKEMECGFVEGR